MTALSAIAKKMLQEFFKKQSPIIIGLLLIALIFSFPFMLKSEGTLKAKLQMTITYSLNLTLIALGLLTLFFGTSSFTGEIKCKQFYLIETKSVYRWQFFIGKFLGLALINLIFLVILAITTLCALTILLQNHEDQEEKKLIRQELLTAYRGIKPEINKEKLTELAKKKLDLLKRQGRLEKNRSEAKIQEEIIRQELQKRNTVAYKRGIRWQFKNLPVNSPNKLKLRYKIFTSQTPPENLCDVIWSVGQGAREYRYKTKVKVQEFVEFTVPGTTVDDDGTLTITFIHLDPYSGVISFPFHNGIEFFYTTGGFQGNYWRGYFLIFMILCFLSLVALFSSSFLTFPVAILLSLCVMFLGIVADFLLEIIPAGMEIVAENKSQWRELSRIGLQSLFVILPNFKPYSPIQYLALGRMIEWQLIIESITVLFLIKGGLVFGISGLVIFHYREIGKPLE